ncbi:hypothetical protein HDV00_006777 [Rhizophlyctis rosea]|nr:hypothetical protein HDV00_006777 [Rhizophlyctis rosea]
MSLSKVATGFQFCSDEQRRAVETALGTDGKGGKPIVLKGCAGSRKTETLIIIGLKNFLPGKRVVFVTLVTSVTVEIMTRLTERIPGSWFERSSGERGNHYTLHTGDEEDDSVSSGTLGSIQVSNLDALHSRLRAADVDMSDIGDQYDQKAQMIVDLDLKDVLLLDGKPADVILWDEAQDSHPSRAEALAQMVSGTPALAHAAGDVMQTIFDSALKGSCHPMVLLARRFSSELVYQTICFRCPLSHILARNEILGKYDERHGCFPLKPSDVAEEGWRPVFFPHGPLTGAKGNFNASVLAVVVFNVILLLLEILADVVFNVILLLLEKDPSLALSDFAVLLPRSNDNPVFNQIEERLNRHFDRDAAIILRSKVNGDRQGINWERAKTLNAVRLLSIHADKGLGYKVVFLLGMTERSLPKQERLFHSTELIDQSLLNVGLTRNSKFKPRTPPS